MAKKPAKKTKPAKVEEIDLDDMPAADEVPQIRSDADKGHDKRNSVPADACPGPMSADDIAKLIQTELAKREKIEVEAEVKRREEEDAAVPTQKEFDSLKEIKEQLSGCSLKWSWLGIQRKVQHAVNAKAAEAIGANEKETSTNRYIINRKMPEWEHLQHIRSKLNGDYWFRTFDYVIDGQRIFRRDMKEEIWGLVDAAKKELYEAAAAFQAKRAEVVRWAQENLGDAFDASLYPQDLSLKFNVEIREHSIEPPSYLRHTNAEEYKQTLNRTLMDVRRSMIDFERQCQSQVAQSIGNVMRALTTGGPLHASNIDNVQEVFRRIATMKFEGTRAFQEAMKAAQEAVDDTDVGELRRSKGCREETRQKFTRLLDRYKQLRALPDVVQ